MTDLAAELAKLIEDARSHGHKSIDCVALEQLVRRCRQDRKPIKERL